MDCGGRAERRHRCGFTVRISLDSKISYHRPMHSKRCRRFALPPQSMKSTATACLKSVAHHRRDRVRSRAVETDILRGASHIPTRVVRPEEFVNNSYTQIL